MSKKDERTREEKSYYDYMKKLQEKYGLPSGSYFLTSKESGNMRKNTKITRTKEGLYIHHVAELILPNLSVPAIAKDTPNHLQEPEMLVYCDMLEHLLTHIMIVEVIIADPYSFLDVVGYGGIKILISKMNDWYAGYPPKETSWEYPCWLKIKDRQSEYKGLLKRAQRAFSTLGIKGRLKTLSARKTWLSGE